ncbi:MAG: DegV family protein [Chloroflexi bacterium]|nr:MAG: DegV family protein [Chloroflexota bacterium]
MSDIHILTDSAARLPSPAFAKQNTVTVVPYQIEIDGKRYREEVDITAEEMLRLLGGSSLRPKLIAPSVEDYIEAYTPLVRQYKAIISIHTSREQTESWANARQAAQQLMGQCAIHVIDSQNICAAQGLLVRLAVEAVAQGKTPEQIIKILRGAIDRIYVAYYLESMHYLSHNKIMSASHAILGTLLGAKPILTIEEGILVPTEKVRTRSQGVERLVEFATEFDDLQDILILQHKQHLTEQARMLQDRLSVEFPGRHFPYLAYGASLAALIGPDATGVVILEAENEIGYDDEF